jgi:hypothetical protein
LKGNSGRPGQPSTRGADLRDNKLYVAGLLQIINEKCFQEYFAKCGYITDILIMKDRNG